MALAPGTRLGAYEILTLIGSGGMGEVYRARDTKLDRDVAIKILPEALASDPERIARFEREAKTLAALNHPHIAHIYGLEESDSVRGLVMELVEGEDLSQRITRGPIPFDEALPIAKQIAEALEAAHEQGIIHRDLKPANVKVRPDGTVKVLDFGLAKALEASSPASTRLTHSPTLSLQATLAGVIVGTAAYMSPEQARGKSADRRADIWAFGVIVFELLSGTQAFEGETISDVLAKVIEREPDWTLLPSSTAPSLRALLRRCLRKDPIARLQAIGDARIELQELIEGRGPAVALTDPPPAGRARTRWFGWVAGVAITLAVAEAVLLALSYRAPAPERAATARFTYEPPQGWYVSSDQAAPGGLAVPLSISPDGRRIAFIARTADFRNSLWVRSLDALDAQQVPHTEGAIAPFWSPDARFVGFFADGKLKKVDVFGGVPTTICDAATFRGATWNDEDVIVFATSVGGLKRVAAAGGIPIDLTKMQDNEVYHTRPVFLPHSGRFLYRAMPNGWTYAASLNSSERTLVLKESDSTNIAISDGHLLFVRGATLMAQRFDAEHLHVLGEAFPVVEQIAMQTPAGTGNEVGIFSASYNGVLTYQAGATVLQRLAWFDREGRQTATVGDAAPYMSVALSPDAKQAAVSVLDPSQQNTDVWVVDVVRGQRTRFTFDPAPDETPVWSADGRQIIFSSRRRRVADLYERQSSQAEAERVLLASDIDKTPWSWSHDGRFLLFGVRSSAGGDVWVLPTTGGQKPYAFLNAFYTETLAQFSPDGRWVAYTSSETGGPQVYVVPFPGPGGKWMVSRSGGSMARWRGDGKELFFLDGGALQAVEVEGGSAVFEYGNPHRLFNANIYMSPRYLYDVAPDGQRFLIVTNATSQSALPITVVLNWHQPNAR